MNRVTIMGRLGKDPETRQVGESQVVKFTVATTRKWTSNGEKREETTWHDVVFWDKIGQVIAQYFKKGDVILVEGRVDIREYEDKDGKKCRAYQVTGNSFEFCGGNKRDSGSGNSAALPPPPNPNGLPF